MKENVLKIYEWSLSAMVSVGHEGEAVHINVGCSAGKPVGGVWQGEAAHALS